MPIQEYRCLRCERTFETIVRGKDEENTGCPECRSGRLERLVSSFSTPSATAGRPLSGRYEYEPAWRKEVPDAEVDDTALFPVLSALGDGMPRRLRARARGPSRSDSRLPG
jgi:putative FmdB family regulatory protein